MATYDQKRQFNSYGGVPLTGLMDSNGVSIEPGSVSAAKLVGADGEVAFIQMADDSATVTIRLQQTSLSNDYLSNQLLLQKAGGPPLSFSAVDASGTSRVIAPEAKIEGFPSVTYSNGIEGREWVFLLGRCTYYVGGNGP